MEEEVAQADMSESQEQSNHEASQLTLFGVQVRNGRAMHDKDDVRGDGSGGETCR